MEKTMKRTFFITLAIFLLAIIFAQPVFAAGAGEVATALEGTWKEALTQIKTITNNVIFPIVDVVLAILLFVKIAMAYFDYKKHGEFEFAPIAILFFGLIFAMTAPLYVWKIVGL